MPSLTAPSFDLAQLARQAALQPVPLEVDGELRAYVISIDDFRAAETVLARPRTIYAHELPADDYAALIEGLAEPVRQPEHDHLNALLDEDDPAAT